MIRVKNEEEFLHAAVTSIIDCVEEVVLVDNQSTDSSPAVIEQLRREHPDKVTAWHYPHTIRKIGRENWRYAEDQEKQDSPHLSANYFNWCKDHCTRSYILNWDGDMIATEHFHETVRSWRSGDTQVVFCRGVNVHPNRRNLITAISTDREAMLSKLSVPGLPRWATRMTRDSPEARIYPRQGSTFTTDRLWTQRISTPFIDDNPERRYIREADGVSYIHLKFCKQDPFSNYSDDLAQALSSNFTVGPPLEAEWQRLLERVGESTPPRGVTGQC